VTNQTHTGKAEEKAIRQFSGVAWPEQRPLSTYW